MGPPSSAKMLEENLWCLLSRRGLPPCLLGGHCWFRPVCASLPAIVSAQRWSSIGWEEPSGSGREVGYLRGGVGSCRVGRYKASVPEVLTAPVAYHAVVLRRSLYGPCGKARSVLPATGERRSCPPYPCQVDRTTADPPMLMSGRLQSRRVSHIVVPTIREHRNMVGGAGDVHVVSIRRVRYRAQFHVRELAEQHHPPSLVITSDRHTGGFFKLVLWTNLRWFGTLSCLQKILSGPHAELTTATTASSRLKGGGREAVLAKTHLHQPHKLNKVDLAIVVFIIQFDHPSAGIRFRPFHEAEPGEHSLQLECIDESVTVLVEDTERLFHFLQTRLLLLKQARELIGADLPEWLTVAATAQAHDVHDHLRVFPTELGIASRSASCILGRWFVMGHRQACAELDAGAEEGQGCRGGLEECHGDIAD
ncbi:hypothetical protein GW17_00051246 [Ensete ventricosum]|nr:hypothetical protein GW17_00051246 [Ensete ventricosum]